MLGPQGPFQPWALTGQGSSQVSPSQPGAQAQAPSVGLQAAPLAQVQLSLQFRPHVPPGQGRVQSRPCHPEEGKAVGSPFRPSTACCSLSPALHRAPCPNPNLSDRWVRTPIPQSPLRKTVAPCWVAVPAVRRAGARMRPPAVQSSLFLRGLISPPGRGSQLRWGALSAQGESASLSQGPLFWRRPDFPL